MMEEVKELFTLGDGGENEEDDEDDDPSSDDEIEFGFQIWMDRMVFLTHNSVFLIIFIYYINRSFTPDLRLKSMILKFILLLEKSIIPLLRLHQRALLSEDVVEQRKILDLTRSLLVNCLTVLFSNL
jgi:hypothetical protein